MGYSAYHGFSSRGWVDQKRSIVRSGENTLTGSGRAIAFYSANIQDYLIPLLVGISLQLMGRVNSFFRKTIGKSR